MKSYPAFMIIRNLLFYLIIMSTSPIFFILGILFFFAPFIVRYRIITAWSHLYIFSAKYLCGLSYRVEGLNNLPSQNAIVFCNHQSSWETLFMQVLLPPQTWVLKKELLYIPIFGWGLFLLEPIAIKRDQFHSINSLIKQGKKRLSQGRYVIIYPEGTRVKPNTLGKFTRSGAALAQSSQYPVIPIAHNSGSFWPKGLFIKKPGVITVKIGPLISSVGKTATEINEEARNWIQLNLP